MSEHFPKSENKVEEDIQLESEQKEQLVHMYTTLAVEATVPETIETMSDDELRQWLYETTMNDVREFMKENEITADEVLLNKLKESSSVEDKSVIEMEYVHSVYEKIDAFAQVFRERGEATKWNSCPSLMRETKSFNCVGSTLIGIELLEQAGIKNQYGNPPGHVVNIAHLSDGRIMYADFLNGKNSVQEVEADISNLEGVPLLHVDKSHIDYELVPLLEKEEIISSILGNLRGMSRDIDNSVQDTDAIEQIERHLYPDSATLDKNQLLKEEKERIEILRTAREPLREFRRALSKEDVVLLTQEIENNKDVMKRCVANKDISLLKGCSENLQVYTQKIIDVILQSPNPEKAEAIFLDKE